MARSSTAKDPPPQPFLVQSQT
ncbi:hypothetical protein CCACVL1_24712, partial [Corchorus capsularis]